MKNFFLSLVIFLFPLCLFSASTADLDKQYRDGLSAYKAKNFKVSYDIFSKLYLTKLSDSKLNFYLGRSAYETGHYEIALAAFERVDMLDSANLRNKLEMGRTYYMLKMYKESESAFRSVLENPNIPQNVRTNVELYLSRVTKMQQKSFTYASVNIDWLYDSNVNYGSLDSRYNVNVGTLPSEPEKSDRALQLYTDIVNIYDIGDSGAYSIKNRVKLFLKDYSNLDAYDVQYVAYTPSLLYKDPKFLAEFVVGVDILTLGRREYMRSVAFTPRYEYSHTNILRSMLSFKYQTKYFSQKNQSDLNSHHYELGYSLQDILSPRSYVQMGLIGLREQKLKGNRIDVDYQEYKLNLAYANQFTNIYAIDLLGEYRRRNYDDYSTLFDSKRHDDGGIVSATLNARIIKSLRFHIKAMYNRVESNQKRFSYQKYTFNIGLNKSF